MKTTIKHNLIIFHNPDEWSRIQAQLVQDFGARIAISFVCRRELGFTVRRHKGLVPHPQAEWEIMKAEGWNHRFHYEEQVHLDFYSESAKTWFVLKYLNNEQVDQ
jgi:hypothetical protein